MKAVENANAFLIPVQAKQAENIAEIVVKSLSIFLKSAISIFSWKSGNAVK